MGKSNYLYEPNGPKSNWTTGRDYQVENSVKKYIFNNYNEVSKKSTRN